MEKEIAPSVENVLKQLVNSFQDPIKKIHVLVEEKMKQQEEKSEQMMRYYQGSLE